MKVEELLSALENLGVPKDLYSILSGGLPNEKLCLVHEDEWRIYYSERGSKTGEKSYLTEDEACEAFLEKMRKYKSITS